MNGPALPPDMPGSRGSYVIGPKTLVPIGVIVAAFCLGFGIDRWANDTKADLAAKIAQAHDEMASLRTDVDLAKVAILAKLDTIAASVVADHSVMMTKEDFDNVWRLAKAMNPAIAWPERR